MEWSYQDYHISIVLKKIPSGAQWYCGYVRVPQKHILYCMCDYNYIQAILKQFNCGFPKIWKYGLTTHIGFDTLYDEYKNISLCEVMGIALQLLVDLIHIQNVIKKHLSNLKVT